MWSALADGFKEFAEVVSADAQSVLDSVSNFTASADSPPGSPTSLVAAEEFAADLPGLSGRAAQASASSSASSKCPHQYLTEEMIRKLQTDDATYTEDLDLETAQNYTPGWMRCMDLADGVSPVASGAARQEQVFAVGALLLRNSETMRNQFQKLFPQCAEKNFGSLEKLQEYVERNGSSSGVAAAPHDDVQSGTEEKQKQEGETARDQDPAKDEMMKSDDKKIPTSSTLLPSSFFVHYFVRLNKLLVDAEMKRRSELRSEQQRAQEARSNDNREHQNAREAGNKQIHNNNSDNSIPITEELNLQEILNPFKKRIMDLEEENASLYRELADAKDMIQHLRAQLEKQGASSSRPMHATGGNTTTTTGDAAQSGSAPIHSTSTSSGVLVSRGSNNSVGDADKLNDSEEEEAWTEIA